MTECAHSKSIFDVLFCFYYVVVRRKNYSLFQGQPSTKQNKIVLCLTVVLTANHVPSRSSASALGKDRPLTLARTFACLLSLPLLRVGALGCSALNLRMGPVPEQP